MKNALFTIACTSLFISGYSFADLPESGKCTSASGDVNYVGNFHGGAAIVSSKSLMIDGKLWGLQNGMVNTWDELIIQSSEINILHEKHTEYMHHKIYSMKLKVAFVENRETHRTAYVICEDIEKITP